MKALLAVVPLILSVVAESPAPYPPSGFRPNGPAFELPQRQPQNTQQQYLPPLDPRRPAPEDPYSGSDDADVSVQGLPTQEQLPIFQPSPINGQQYVGPALQKDLKNLDDSYRQQQYQLQQEKYREYERQRQLEAQANKPIAPRQFGRTTSRPETSTTQNEDNKTTTEAIELNEGETLDDDSKKVTVEVSKQKLQEYPGEFYLSSLAQLQLQPQFAPFQISQLRAPLIVQPGFSQKQVAGYDAQTHFAALPSVLAQKQLFEQSQQQVNQQYTAPIQPLDQQQFIAPVNQYQPLIQPQTPEIQAFPQIQAQPVVLQPQSVNQPQFYAQPTSDTEQVEEKEQVQPQPQFVFQTQQGYPQQGYQPQAAYQPQSGFQPQLAYQPQYPQPNVEQNYPQVQYVNYPTQDLAQYQPQLLQQPQFLQQQAQFGQQQGQGQGQDAFLQSGLDVNQEGNGVEQDDKEGSDDGNQGVTATAVATAFGTRTQPRVQYGVPSPRVQADPRYQATTEGTLDATTVDSPVVAEATAVASPGSKRKSAKLRRLRPVFTLDKSGHLVLAEQN
ncbi:transcription factor SPT20 homolog isoform X2 [Plodia interpunctella]|uniref:transcription factor SPT20 homolog isoform X2 n=1 Tax=Plodia interpunctella TaxID=58824 RepID=UPI0023682614|nr:transcription factor SPT20 homolog isoform X2 [Plodia interpunctella]